MDKYTHSDGRTDTHTHAHTRTHKHTHTHKYTKYKKYMKTRQRPQIKPVDLKKEEIGTRTSLRFSVQMLTPARIIAETAGRTLISEDDIKEVDELFFDGKASAKLLAHSEGYMK